MRIGIIKYFKYWNKWRKQYPNFSKLHKLLVLLKLRKSPSMMIMIFNAGVVEATKAIANLNNALRAYNDINDGGNDNAVS